jgi:flagellar FliL protein
MADKKDTKEEEGEEKEKESGEEGKEEGAEGNAEDAAKRKKKRKLLIIAAAAAVLLGGGGSAVYFSGMLSGTPQKTEAGVKKDKKKKGGEEAERGTTGSSVKAVKSNPNEWIPGVIPGHEADDVVYYNLPEFLVNLDTNSKQTSFIKMKVTLEAPSEGDAVDAIDNRLPRIVDKFNETLRLLRISDISGSAGLYRLREELLLQVNKIINPSKVNDILFQEIIVQ